MSHLEIGSLVLRHAWQPNAGVISRIQLRRKPGYPIRAAHDVPA
jgi:hypothetical protein